MEELRIILDANFLMVPESHGVDIFSELDRIIDKKYELFVPEVVIGELKNLKETGNTSEKRSANVALELASELEKVPSDKPADEEILDLAEGGGSAVATNDSDLKRRLREKGIPVIYLRQRSHLSTDGKLMEA